MIELLESFTRFKKSLEKKDPWPSQWAWPLVYADNNVETSKAFMLLSFVVQLSASLMKKTKLWPGGTMWM